MSKSDSKCILLAQLSPVAALGQRRTLMGGRIDQIVPALESVNRGHVEGGLAIAPRGIIFGQTIVSLKDPAGQISGRSRALVV